MSEGRWFAPSCFLFLLSAYHLIFGQFFPTKIGTLGDDYSFILPNLLDGYFWYKNNGLLEPFWFTPAFCGGLPALGDPQSGYYSVVQFLTFFANPLSSVYATVLLFASLGFWGFCLLLRTCFGSSSQASVLGGALFMFNGFFIHRMMIGQFAFHGVMLIPLIAWFLLRPAARQDALSVLTNGAAAGCMFAYGVYSGMVNLLLPGAIAVLGIFCIHGLTCSRSRWVLHRSMFAALVASCLSAAKLTGALLFLNNFPRSDYSLPGISGVWNALQLLFSVLFFSPANIAERAQPLVTGIQWPLVRHAWEYGVTAVPLLIILTGSGLALIRARGRLPHLSQTKWIWAALSGFILVLPLALNIYSPAWNAFLKHIPMIKSSSNLLRWFLIYIPIVILATALLLDKISPLTNRRNGILMAAVVALILINAVKDRSYYQAQTYPPDTIVNAWRTAHAGTEQARIQYIVAFVDANNQIQMPVNRNDEIATWGSQLACYNPMFGYRLEHFPVKSLHPGPVLAESNGLLNLKNPACYTYPEQNNCTPGDHFTVAQRKAAEAFASYKPYSFSFSSVQKIANRITLTSLTLLALLFVMVLSKKILRSLNDK